MPSPLAQLEVNLLDRLLTAPVEGDRLDRLQMCRYLDVINAQLKSAAHSNVS